ncbi:MAG: hypothetical protein HZB26_14545 [Candidatus Hydrogenedentes bacterium]|nr:hypothetical protein [Candidatus Hydrogenedentota bacterium]
MEFTQAWAPREKESNQTVQTSEAEAQLFKDGREFKVVSWHPWQRMSYAEVEVSLEAPEPVIWRIRLHRDKPYLEQRFEAPAEWRASGRALVQRLGVAPSLEPVMPTDVFSKGFSNGRPNLAGRHRFEFVSQSDHLAYDLGPRIGLAAFVAGIGGEERILPHEFFLIDHASSDLKTDGTTVRFLLWPSEGSVEKGFSSIRTFVADEYSCQRDKYNPFAWNQFWLWQGGPQPAGSEVVTAARLLDILPQLSAAGCEELHLDAGWEVAPGDWRFDPKRFPEGFEPIRQFLREHGMRYHTWMCNTATDDPEGLKKLIEQTDLCKLFMDRTATELSVASMREVRKSYPDFETFVHHTTSRSAYYPWGNIHFLSDFNQVYFGEGQFWSWSNVLPGNAQETDVNKRFYSTHSLRAGDLVTRSAAYQAHWAWPYKCIVPPHCGWAWLEDRGLDELASRMFTTIAARYDYQWGEDPRMLRDEVRNFFLDWTAYFKAARPYLQQYQHVLPVPDGLHPDGAAHLKDGKGFIVLCNPSDQKTQVEWKEILWEPELEFDPDRSIRVSDWTHPLAPRNLRTVNVGKPKGSLALEPLSYKVIGLDVDVTAMLNEIREQRARLH